MANYQITSFSQLAFVSMFTSFVLLIKTENVIAFSAQLYQRDSFGSPFYDPNISEREIIRRAITRSVNKFNIITLNSPISHILEEEGDYLIKIRLGTPPLDIYGVVDTGSDFIWTQCQPCIRCFRQTTPIFNPHSSSSYYKIRCGPSTTCPSNSYSQCQIDDFCHHHVSYGDNSYSNGYLSKEIMRMDSTYADEVVQVSNFIFGCGSDNDGLFEGTSSGIIGLGFGPLSLVTQLGKHAMQRFSYCLIRPGKRNGSVSHIRFGRDAIVNGPGTVTIPLISKPPSCKYYITLEAFTIGGTRVNFIDSSSRAVKEGNMIIDSGTFMTLLPKQFYDKIVRVVTMHTNAPIVSDPRGLLELCFRRDSTLKLPDIVANFRGGDVLLKRYNVFVVVKSDVACMSFGVISGLKEEGIGIYGYVAQQNFIVGYDQRGSISFKPFECSYF